MLEKIYKYSWLLFIVLLLNCKEKPIDEASGTFSALSYNVAGLPNGISSSEPILYTSLISPSLNSFDIVHVQEDFCYHDSLMLYNNHSCVTEPLPCIGDGLNTMTNFNIIAFERIKWDDCTNADCLSLKGFTYSKIELHKDVTIDFYNIHCNAGSSNESIEARRNNLTQFLSYLNANSTDEPIIIMGDLNHKYTREGDSTRVLLDLGFSDPWIDLITNGLIPDYDTLGLKNCYPINTSSMCEGVDKVFYRSNDEMELKVLSYQYGDDDRFYYQGDDTQPLSDHSPLAVTIQYDFRRK